LAGAIIKAARQDALQLSAAIDISERPGEGLCGTVKEDIIQITGRNKVDPEMASIFPPTSGLECLVLINGELAGIFHFHDAPRKESQSFIRHLRPRHNVNRILLVSGDRQSEVQYLATLVGIAEVHAEKTPEEKVTIVRDEVRRQHTAFIGDGINDAPALTAATVGIAFGQTSDITAEAADAVIMSSSIGKVDELIHIGARMRSIALQSAVGGMALSVAGMLAAALGWLPALQGAIAQEVIDLAAVLNAVRVALPTRNLSDY
jgi:P-type E1-E2 ATPase